MKKQLLFVLFVIPITVIIFNLSCKSDNRSNSVVKRSNQEEAILQDKYVSSDSEINALRKKFDKVLFKHDSLTGYKSGIEEKFEAEASKIIKIKQKINLLLLRETMTNDEKRTADSLINNLGAMIDNLKSKASK